MTDHPDTPENSWGRWGEDDERGALNLLSPERIVAATATVTRGRVYPLGVPIQRNGVPYYDYRGAPYRLTLTNDADQARFTAAGAPAGAGSNADLLVSATHHGTHMDALAHVYSEGRIYNGYPSSSFTTAAGAARCGIDKAGGVVARAVLLDVAGSEGVDSLDDGVEIDAATIERAESRQDVRIEAGDVVLLHTGWLGRWMRDDAAGHPASMYRLPGLGLDGARLLVERDIAAVGADNPSVEALGGQTGGYIPVHRELIARRGITFLELLDLREPVAAGISTGLLVVAPLRITGASGSPVNPLLIV